MAVDLRNRFVRYSPSQLGHLSLRPFGERLPGAGKVAAAGEFDARVLREQHVVDTKLLETSGAVKAVLAARLPFGPSNPLTRCDDTGHAGSRGSEVGAQLLEPARFPDLHVAREQKQHEAAPFVLYTYIIRYWK